MPKNKTKYEASDLVSIRLSEVDAALVNNLVKKLGINVSGLFRFGIREIARQMCADLNEAQKFNRYQKQATPRKKSA